LLAFKDPRACIVALAALMLVAGSVFTAEAGPDKKDKESSPRISASERHLQSLEPRFAAKVRRVLEALAAKGGEAHRGPAEEDRRRWSLKDHEEPSPVWARRRCYGSSPRLEGPRREAKLQVLDRPGGGGAGTGARVGWRLEAGQGRTPYSNRPEVWPRCAEKKEEPPAVRPEPLPVLNTAERFSSLWISTPTHSYEFIHRFVSAP